MEKPIQTEQALRARITELEQAQTREQTRQQEEARQAEEFQRLVSHELRNPLTSIRGNVQLARRAINTLMNSEQVPEEVLQALELTQALLNRAENQVHIQNRLIEDLLDSMRIQAGNLELHKESSDLVQLVSMMIAEQRRLNPQRSISLQNATGVGELFVLADSKHISQVLTHYMNNALKYSPSGSPIQVSIEQEGHMVRVIIKDEGQGLPSDEQDQIWYRFYRVPTIKVLNGPSARLGLGLYISRALIEQYGGQVGVTSKGEQGSTFWFTLPLAESDHCGRF
ncbi:MAG TPA: ATP-binding protein [Ktedonobacteraceae bacterium]